VIERLYGLLERGASLLSDEEKGDDLGSEF
jgi:hypothetical protein